MSEIVVARMDRRWDAEDEGFKTFETPEVSGTWRQRHTTFNAPWKTDSGVTPAMWCLFQLWCSSASEFTHFILVVTFFLEHHSLWVHLMGITCLWSQNFSALVWCTCSLIHWFCSRKHVILTDGYLKPFDDGQKQENVLLFAYFKMFWISWAIDQGYCWNLLWSERLDWCGLAAEGICFLS